MREVGNRRGGFSLPRRCFWWSSYFVTSSPKEARVGG